MQKNRQPAEKQYPRATAVGVGNTSAIKAMTEQYHYTFPSFCNLWLSKKDIIYSLKVVGVAAAGLFSADTIEMVGYIRSLWEK